MKLLLGILMLLLTSQSYALERMEGEITEKYVFHDMFLGGLLMYRPRGTELLKVVDLNKATIKLIKFGPPDNCMKIVIDSSDGLIFGKCIKPEMR